MQDILREIRKYLRENAYQNEEQVRLSLVCRVLRALGWDIWNPREVKTEFAPNPNEDSTKVDLALFIKNDIPAVFIEAKAVGKIDDGNLLGKAERQARDYNKNNTAMFSIITDGRKWRFYDPKTQGEFHLKCFKRFDLLEDELEEVEEILRDFLTEANLPPGGHAEIKAKEYLNSAKKQKAMQDCLPEARRIVVPNFHMNTIQALSQVLEKNRPDLSFTREEIEKYLANVSDSLSTNRSSALKNSASKGQTTRARKLSPNGLEGVNVKHSKISRAKIGGHAVKSWHAALEKMVVLALGKGHAVEFIDRKLRGGIIKGKNPNAKNYSWIPRYNVWVIRTDANTAFRALIRLAKILRCRIDLELVYSEDSPHHSGETKRIRLLNNGTAEFG